MTIHRVPQDRPPTPPGPMHCYHCGTTAHEDPTVYQRITITGEKQPPLCGHCAVKQDRAARLSRRGECAE